MLFSRFVLDRLTLLDRAARGYGDRISERALYEALNESLGDSEDFAVLIDWGLSTGLLVETTSVVGRQFCIDRRVLVELRRRANGEPGDARCAAAPRRTGRRDFKR